jgi:hypothetical protein
MQAAPLPVMPNPSIAGPRRHPRPAARGAEPSVVIPPAADSAPTTPYLRRSDIHTLTRHAAARPLPSLDYDESDRLPRSMLSTRPGRRHTAHRLRWLVLGIALGAVGSVLARGDGPATIRSLRFWGADLLRSLEHRPRTCPTGMHAAPVAPSRALPSTSASASSAPAPAPELAPTPALMLAMNVPTVRIEDLPRARPPRAPTVAHHHRTPPHAAVARSPAPDDDQNPTRDDAQLDGRDDPPSDETAADTAGHNPYLDDQASANNEP